MTKKPTWPEVWLEIAEAFYTPRKWRTKRQRGITRRGLCHAVDVICGRGNEVIYSGVNIYYDDLNSEDAIWWWPGYAPKYDIPRAVFAEHMAGIPHADFEDFINGRSDMSSDKIKLAVQVEKGTNDTGK